VGTQLGNRRRKKWGAAPSKVRRRPGAWPPNGSGAKLGNPRIKAAVAGRWADRGEGDVGSEARGFAEGGKGVFVPAWGPLPRCVFRLRNKAGLRGGANSLRRTSALAPDGVLGAGPQSRMWKNRGCLPGRGAGQPQGRGLWGGGPVGGAGAYTCEHGGGARPRGDSAGARVAMETSGQNNGPWDKPGALRAGAGPTWQNGARTHAPEARSRVRGKTLRPVARPAGRDTAAGERGGECSADDDPTEPPFFSGRRGVGLLRGRRAVVVGTAVEGLRCVVSGAPNTGVAGVAWVRGKAVRSGGGPRWIATRGGKGGGGNPRPGAPTWKRATSTGCLSRSPPNSGVGPHGRGAHPRATGTRTAPGGLKLYAAGGPPDSERKVFATRLCGRRKRRALEGGRLLAGGAGKGAGCPGRSRAFQKPGMAVGLISKGPGKRARAWGSTRASARVRHKPWRARKSQNPETGVTAIYTRDGRAHDNWVRRPAVRGGKAVCSNLVERRRLGRSASDRGWAGRFTRPGNDRVPQFPAPPGGANPHTNPGGCYVVAVPQVPRGHPSVRRGLTSARSASSRNHARSAGT